MTALTKYRARVVVFDPPVEEEWARKFAEVIDSADIELVVPTSTVQADLEVRSADIVIATGRRRVDRAVVGTLGRARGILCMSVGTDQVDLSGAARAGIEVANVPDYCTQEVADHALALLLAAQRRLFPTVRATRSGVWTQRDTDEVNAIRRLGRQTLGVIGAGRIGRLVAARARAFGFTTIAHDPRIRTPVDDQLRLTDLPSLAQWSDAVVVCAALTPGSRHIIGRSFFEQAKGGLVLVNVARAGLVDETALLAALDDGTVSVAALDVRELIRPGQRDPLQDRDNVLVTPHLAGTSIEAVDDLMRQAASRTRAMLARRAHVSPTEGAVR